jgi:hypothetical protein
MPQILQDFHKVKKTIVKLESPKKLTSRHKRGYWALQNLCRSSQNYTVKEDEMGGTCTTHGSGQEYVQIFDRKPRNILQWATEKYVRLRTQVGFSGWLSTKLSVQARNSSTSSTIIIFWIILFLGYSYELEVLKERLTRITSRAKLAM